MGLGRSPMFWKSVTYAATATITALLFTISFFTVSVFTVGFAAAQDQPPALKITRPSALERKEHIRSTNIAEMDRDAAFNRVQQHSGLPAQQRSISRELVNTMGVSS